MAEEDAEAAKELIKFAYFNDATPLTKRDVESDSDSESGGDNDDGAGQDSTPARKRAATSVRSTQQERRHTNDP